MYTSFFKRFLDILLATVGLVLSWPLLCAISLILHVHNAGKVFFVQERAGLRGKPFLILKFKTMNDQRNEQGELFPDKERTGSLGRFLRKTSLDELPQLLNVLKGDLSMVGPRPLLMEYLPLYTSEQARRNSVKPGITGLAQVNGRNSISWEEKFSYDVFYADNLSFWMDIKIIFKTISIIITLQDINSSSEETMEKFKGSKL